MSPEAAGDLVARAAAWCDAGRPADAAALLGPWLRPDGAADGWLVQARALLALGDLGAALTAATTATGLAPDDPRGPALAGLTLSELGRHDAAVAATGRAVELDPRGAGWHHGLAVVLLRAERWPEALSAARTALAFDPDVPAYLTTAGTAAAEAGDRREARACLREALRLAPHDPVARHELARLRRGRGVAFGLSRLARAVRRPVPQLP